MHKRIAIGIAVVVLGGVLGVLLLQAQRSPTPSISLTFIGYSDGEHKARFNIINPTHNDIAAYPFVYLQIKTPGGWTNATAVAWRRDNRDTMLLEPIYRHQSKTITFEAPSVPDYWRAGIRYHIVHRSPLSWLNNDIRMTITNTWSSEIRR